MEIKTVSIIGLGALGVLFGHHLSQKMPFADLRIIADKDRILKYQNNGVYCNGEPCRFHYMTPNEKDSPADLVIFAVKFRDLADAIGAMKHQIGENTIIISALNGIRSETDIAAVYGEENLLYCVAQGMDAVKEENKLTYHNMGVLCFGEKEEGIVSPKMERVRAFFEKTELPFEMHIDMMHRLWGKFMLNVGVNQTAAVYEGTYGTIQQEGDARDTMIAAMREVITLSIYEGVPLNEADLDYWLNVLSKLSPVGKPSMRQDMEARRYSEVDLFSGTVLELGKKHGILTPVNQWLYDKVKSVENTY